jgi:serine/threonine-protein kinase
MALEVGQTLDSKYRIVRVIGVGGMGTVYEGEHTLIRRRVAIKVLAKNNSKEPDSVRRFEREAQAAGHIGSDHILEVLDLGTTDEGAPYMVMEYLEGRTLADVLERTGRLSAAQIAPIARQILAGLAAAHDAKIVHRDLKPSNVFIVREKAGLRDFVKIIDFGISKFEVPEIASRLTQSGAVLGTPYYMSPEQARGQPVDARSDLHAVGVILFEAVTGRPPFDGKNFNELMFQIGGGDRPRPQRFAPDLDPRFATIIEKAMMLKPQARYQTAQEFARDVEHWMRANSLATTTGEVVLADLPPMPPMSRADPSAITVAAESDGPDRRRTVTNASVDTLTPGAQRSRRWRWVALGAGLGVGFAVVSAVIVVRRPAVSVTAEPSLTVPPLSQPPAAPVPGAELPATLASGVPGAIPSASALASAAPAAGSAHAPEARPRAKPPKGGAKPAGGKPVDFGY